MTEFTEGSYLTFPNLGDFSYGSRKVKVLLKKKAVGTAKPCFEDNLALVFFLLVLKYMEQNFIMEDIPFLSSGIFEITPRDVDDLGEQFKFKQSLLIGHTDFTDSDIRQIVEELRKQDIPSWVNRLADMSPRVPFLQRCLPKEWPTPVALQASLQENAKTSTGQTEENQL
ncbi:deubiquitinase DESI2 [Trichonephila inaurata madagascariensis]|uniref:Deubiquitinase DESI2 n=1 Tax=Trichonephila inaurata madagascariensis TaxID=2747483 RepID=A0A8X6YEG6_9ARAC|nr:deubiquitinase DESI2 [Trichonephila inaurata madagascariensis]